MAKNSGKKTVNHKDDVAQVKASRKKTGKFEKPAPIKHKKRGNGLVIAICILVPVLLLGAAACYFFMPEMGGLKDNGLILDNVTIAGIDVGGLSKADAVAAVEKALAGNQANASMTVTVLDQEVQLTPDVTGFTLDVEAAVDAAYRFGRSGSSVQRNEEKLLAATTGLKADITDLITVDENAIAARLDSLQIASTGNLIQSTWEVVGTAPELQAAEAPTELQTLAITKGEPGYRYDQQSLIAQIIAAYRDGVSQVVCDCEAVEPDPLDLDAIFAQICTPAADATMDPETFEITPHTYGVQFDLQAAKEGLANAAYGEKLEYPFQLILPELLEKDLSSKLFCDVLASYDSYQASNSNRATNMQLACKAINGTVLLPGEVFSFNDTVGERTAAKGYKTAPAYEGGKTVQSFGGGVCQPSSTIYYCALLADLEIVERDCHSYPSVYVPWGMDATVNWLTLDFKFRNNTQYPLRIDASADDYGTVSIALVGTDTKDYYVKMENEILAGYEPKEKIIEVHVDNNPNGYKDGQEITSPAWGYKVQTYKLKYSKADDSLIEKTKEAISIYTKRDREVVRLIGAEEEEEDPTQAPTDPPSQDTPTDPPSDTPTDPPTDTPTDPPADTPTDPPTGNSSTDDPSADDPPPDNPPADS